MTFVMKMLVVMIGLTFFTEFGNGQSFVIDLQRDEAVTPLAPLRAYDSTDNPIPVIDHQYGVLAYPTDYIEIPDKLWRHVLKFELPCINSYLSQDIVEGWRTNLVAITAALRNLRPKATNDTVRESADIDSLLVFASSVEKKLDNLEVRHKYLHTEAQYMWGLIKEDVSCHLVAISPLRPKTTQIKNGSTMYLARVRQNDSVINITNQTSTHDVNSTPLAHSQSFTTKPTTIPLNKKVIPEPPKTDNETTIKEGKPKTLAFNRVKRQALKLTGLEIVFPDGKAPQLVVDDVRCNLNAGSHSGRPTRYTTPRPYATEAHDMVNDDAEVVQSSEDTGASPLDENGDNILEMTPMKNYQKSLKSILAYTTHEGNMGRVGRGQNYFVYMYLCVVDENVDGRIRTFSTENCMVRKALSDRDIDSGLVQKFAGNIRETELRRLEVIKEKPRTIKLSSRAKRSTQSFIADLLNEIPSGMSDHSCVNTIYLGSHTTMYAGNSTLSIAGEMTNDGTYIEWNPTVGISNCLTIGEFVQLLRPVEVKQKQESSRSKRDDSWLTRNVWKPLFGFSSESDLDKVRQQVDQNKNTLGKVIVQQNAMLSLSKESQSAMKAMHESINQTVQEINTYAANLSDTLVRMLDDNTQKTEALWFTASISSVHIQLSSLNSVINDLSSQVESVIDTYNSYKEMFTRGNLDIRLFTSSAQREFDNLMKTQQNTYRLPRDWPGLYNLNQRLVSVAITSGRTMVMIIKIPLMRHDSPKDIFRVVTYPLSTEDSSMHLLDQPDYVVISKGSQEWYSLTTNEYLQCRMEPFRVCNYRFTKHRKLSEYCVLSLLASSDPSPAPCRAEVRPLLNGGSSEYTQISSRQWVANIRSPGNSTSQAATVECSGMSPAISDSIEMPLGYQMITIEMGCKVETQTVVLEPIKEWWNTDTNEIPFHGVSSISLTPNQTVEIVHTVRLAQPSFNTTKLQLKMPYLSLDKTMSLINQTNSVLTVIDSRQKEIEDGSWINSFQDSFGRHVYPESWTAIQSLVVTIISGVIILVICYIILQRYKAPQVPLAAVTFSKLATEAHANVTTTEGPTGINLTMAEQIFDHITNHQSLIMSIMLIMMIIMILLHLHQCWRVMGVTHKCGLMYRALAQNFDCTARNITGPHHSGEARVILHCVMKVTRLDKSEYSLPCSIQLTTLPLPVLQWFVRDKAQSHLMVTGSTSYRWNRFLRAQLNWKRACIQSHKYPMLDVCADLPVSCVVPISDVSHLLYKGSVIPWWSLCIEHCLGIELTYGHEKNVLYHYVANRDRVFKDSDILLGSV